MIPKREPPARNTVTKYITMLLRKVSELASWILWLSSQKKWEICKTVQKDSRHIIKLSNKECRTLIIQHTSTNSQQSRGSWWLCSAGGDRWPHADVGHHGKEEVVQLCKQNEKVHLGDAALKCYDFALGLDVPHHLRWRGKVKILHNLLLHRVAQSRTWLKRLSSSSSFCLSNSACSLQSLDHVGHTISEGGDSEY